MLLFTTAYPSIINRTLLNFADQTRIRKTIPSVQPENLYCFEVQVVYFLIFFLYLPYIFIIIHLQFKTDQSKKLQY